MLQYHDLISQLNHMFNHNTFSRLVTAYLYISRKTAQEVAAVCIMVFCQVCKLDWGFIWDLPLFDHVKVSFIFNKNQLLLLPVWCVRSYCNMATSVNLTGYGPRKTLVLHGDELWGVKFLSYVCHQKYCTKWSSQREGEMSPPPPPVQTKGQVHSLNWSRL